MRLQKEGLFNFNASADEEKKEEPKQQLPVPTTNRPVANLRMSPVNTQQYREEQEIMWAKLHNNSIGPDSPTVEVTSSTAQRGLRADLMNS